MSLTLARGLSWGGMGVGGWDGVGLVGWMGRDGAVCGVRVGALNMGDVA